MKKTKYIIGYILIVLALALMAISIIFIIKDDGTDIQIVDDFYVFSYNSYGSDEYENTINGEILNNSDGVINNIEIKVELKDYSSSHTMIEVIKIPKLEKGGKYEISHEVDIKSRIDRKCKTKFFVEGKEVDVDDVDSSNIGWEIFTIILSIVFFEVASILIRSAKRSNKVVRYEVPSDVSTDKSINTVYKIQSIYGEPTKQTGSEKTFKVCHYCDSKNDINSDHCVNCGVSLPKE